MQEIAYKRVHSFVEKHAARLFRAPLEDLTAGEQIVRVVWDLDAQVHNGGFHQYFSNSSGEGVPYVLWALDVIGATEVQWIVCHAIELLPVAVPWSNEALRWECMEQLGDAIEHALDQLSTSFHNEAAVLMDQLDAYIQAHPREFVGSAPH